MVTDTQTTTLPHDPAKAELWRMVEKLGSQKAAAEELEIHPSYLGEMLSGKNPISENVLKKIGYVRVVVNVKEDHVRKVVMAIEDAMTIVDRVEKLEAHTVGKIKAVSK